LRYILDTYVPILNKVDTTFETYVFDVTRKSPGPYSFLEVSGDVIVFELPDFVVVCDVMKVGGGCFNTGKDNVLRQCAYHWQKSNSICTVSAKCGTPCITPRNCEARNVGAMRVSYSLASLWNRGPRARSK
jgi:hypothetical protein